MTYGYRTPVFDIRREGFPPGVDGDNQYREFQNFTAKLNRFVEDMILNRERLIFETGITKPTDTSVAYLYVGTDGNLYFKKSGSSTAIKLN